jgi:hypothetical protein
MVATLNWLWGKFLSLILKGKRLEIPMVKTLLQVTLLARSRIATVLRTTAGFETLYGVPAKPLV